MNVFFGDYSIFCGEMAHLPTKNKLVINTVNQYSYCIANEDLSFKNALKDSDVLLPDGVGIVAAVKLVNGRAIKKISGSDIHRYLLDMLADSGGVCFYLGATNHTLKKISERIHIEYPSITCNYYSPPFKANFSKEDTELMIEKINESHVDVVFVGMTAPKQEKWVFENKDKIHAKIICSIGAVFDFYAGTLKRPSDIWINLGLEWFARLCKEPVRMWKRYMYYGPVFVYSILREKFAAEPHQAISAGPIKSAGGNGS